MENTTGDTKEQEDSEYESDPEELKLSLKMRRREASDDEDYDDDDKAAGSIGGEYDGESDGQGAAAEYDDGDDNDNDGDDNDNDDDDENDEGEYYDDDDEEAEFDDDEVERKVVRDGQVAAREAMVVEEGGENRGVAEGGEGGGEGEEKKENEPFAVPTSGAFYMHDDRFRDSNGPPGRHRRTFGGRKLWESKDDKKWGHDKFEEMNLRDRHYEEGRRSSRGSFRGRGKTRGTDRGYARGGRMKGYGGNNNQSAPPKDVRGRGPRRYQPSMKNRSETHSQNNRQSRKSTDRILRTGRGRVASTTASLNVEHEQLPAKKVASNLNSASPPFYPSGSSSKDTALSQKEEVQAGNHNRNIRPSAVSHSSNLMRGKNVVDSMGMDKLHINDSVSPAMLKPLNSVHMPPSASMSVGAAQVTQSRAQGRGVVSSGSALFQPQTNNQINKLSSSAVQPSQHIPVHTRGQSSQQAVGQQLVHRPLGGSQTSAPPPLGGLPVATSEPGNFVSPSESGKSKVSVAGKGKGSVQGTGRDAIVYGGAPVMGPGGNVSTGHTDPNLPAFFPVMQFGGQHPGGIPAVGMAFPGYVAQPNGLGSSEMTWLPVLSGALGGSYCPPYLSVDGSYNPRPTGQASALPASSEDNLLNKSINELKPQQRSDVANDEFTHRQNKPRRYSEMNFSQ